MILKWNGVDSPYRGIPQGRREVAHYAHRHDRVQIQTGQHYAHQEPGIVALHNIIQLKDAALHAALEHASSGRLDRRAHKNAVRLRGVVNVPPEEKASNGS